MDMGYQIMAKISITGMDKYMSQLDKLTGEVTKINRGALGEGAGIAADNIKAALEGMPTRGDDEYATSKWKLYGATESEKQQIISNFGITRFRTNGDGYDTVIGFTGYVNTPSTRFHDNVPTGMLMQCINNGNEYRRATHTINKAVNGTRAQVEAAVQQYIDEKTQEIMG